MIISTGYQVFRMTARIFFSYLMSALANQRLVKRKGLPLGIPSGRPQERSPDKRLEIELQSELNQSRIARGGDLPVQRTDERSIHCERVRVIEHVEHLGAEL